MGSIQISSMSWERSGKPGRFSFFPKGALTHHPLKRAVVALPLVGNRALSEGDCGVCGTPLDKAAFLSNCQTCPCSRHRGFRFVSPLFMGWYIATPSRRLPVSTCHRQLDTDTGV